MPFFKFRRGDSAAVQPAASAAQPQSVEVLRKRARQRLMGASVLVLLGVIGFPVLFETQPRPVAVDIPIEIPGKNSVRPLVAPTPSVATAPVNLPVPAPAAAPASLPAPAATVAATSPVPAPETYSSRPAALPDEPAFPAVKKEARPEVKSKVEARPEPVAEPRPTSKPAAGDDGARATALLNGTAVPSPPSRAADLAKPAATEESKAASAETKGRMVVQVGAFADAAKAEETRRKLEKAGLSTYTQVTDTKDGKRIRVRVGPFANKAEAEKAVNKIRSLDLPVAILSF